MKLLVCGPRDMHTNHYQLVKESLTTFGATEIIHGGASGADMMADFAAKELNMPVTVFNANWNIHGKAAGPIRNQQMLDEGKPGAVLAFQPKTGLTKGTGDMVRRSKQAGLIVYLVTF